MAEKKAAATAKTRSAKQAAKAKQATEPKPELKKAKVTRRPKIGRNVVTASRCPKCGSTERTPYSNTITKRIDGVDQSGQIYDTVKWRTTCCVDCGQKRVDRVTLLERKKRTA